jgi:hypothetical protein
VGARCAPFAEIGYVDIMDTASKIRAALARGVKAARGRRANKRAITARRKVSRNTPGPGSTSPGEYGIGAPDRFGNSF